MKIYLAGVPREVLNAREWFNDSKLADVLRDLEQHIEKCEPIWGECSVFVETTLPGFSGGGGSQTDLIVAFSSRVGLFEIKGSREPADNWASQLELRKRILERHLSARHINRDCVACFLWTPRLDFAGLRRVFASIRGVNNHLRFINPVGGKSEMRGRTIDEKFLAYMPEALIERFERMPAENLGRGVGKALTDLIAQAAEEIGAPLIEFSSFTDLRRYLSSRVAEENIELLAEPSYVVGLRQGELAAALASLRNYKFLEIYGPQGVGKSSFIKETLTEMVRSASKHYAVFDCVLRRKGSVREILDTLADEAGLLADDRVARLDEDELYDELAANEFVYWIKDYDRKSTAALQLLSRKMAHQARSGAAFWIVESMVGSDEQALSANVEPRPVKLPPFDNASLVTILKERKTEQSTLDPEEVALRSEGITRLAILRWTLPVGAELPKAGRLDQYDLFRYHLAEDERALVRALAFILSQSPLGTTVRLVEEWCRSISRVSADRAHQLACNVIEKAWQQRLISVELFGSRVLGEQATVSALRDLWTGSINPELAVELVPKRVHRALVGWIRVLDPHFIDHYLDEISPEDRKKWRGRLDEVMLADLKHDRSLSGVSLALLAGDVEPFAQSSFRSSASFLPRLQSWLTAADETGALSADDDIIYFRRWLTWLIQHYWDHESGIRTPVPVPDVKRPKQLMLRDILSVRSQLYRQGADCDWPTWSRVADELWADKKFDLWAEALLRQAQVILRAPFNDTAKAWELMRTVLDQQDKLSIEAGRSLMCFHVLSFLNKVKIWRGRFPEVEAQAEQLVPILSANMIADGIVVENVNSIANALFFFVRAIEVSNRPTDLSEVEAYLTIMRFVERVSPARRVQAILTQGSVHRHFISRDQLDWPTFQHHADQALQLFDRVIDGSGRAGLQTHASTALSYSLTVLTKALRYSEVPAARDWVVEMFPAGLEKLSRLANRVPERTAGDRQLASNFSKHVAIGKWISCTLQGERPVGELADSFSEFSSSLLRLTEGTERGQQLKAYQQALTDISRAIYFTRSSATQAQALRECAPALLPLLENVSRLLPSPKAMMRSSLGKHAQRMAMALVGAGVTLHQPNSVSAPHF